MKIDAPQLASPASFEFEIRSRVHWIWIGVTFFVALIFSWLLKVILKHRIKLGEAKLDAQKLIDRITWEAKERPYSVFNDAYNDEHRKLKKAMKGDSAKDIDDAKLALDKKWKEELENAEKRHQDEQNTLNKVLEITNYSGPVLPDMVKAIEEARREVHEVEEMLKLCNLPKAGEKRDEIIKVLSKAIKGSAETWRNQIQNIIKMIQTGQPGIPSSDTISTWLAQSAAILLVSLQNEDMTSNFEAIEDLPPTLGEFKNIIER